MFDIGYFAAGIVVAWITWTATSYIRTDFIRTTLRAILTAICVTPAVIAGHGIGLLPAYLLLFKENYIWWGLIPMVTVAVILLIVFFSVPGIRQDYNNEITWRDILIRPARFKLFLIGLIIVLFKSEFHQTLNDMWWIRILIFMSIIGLHPFLCYVIQRDVPHSSVRLPVWFVIPHAFIYYPVAIIYYFSGLAGSFAGKRDFYHACLTGAIGTGFASLIFGQQLYNAIKYAGVQHIKYQGGITGSAILFIFVASIFIFCMVGSIKNYTTRKKS